MSDLTACKTKLSAGVRVGFWMRAAVLSFMCFFVLAASLALADEIAPQAESRLSDVKAYRLGAGDKINITVYGEEEYSLKNFSVPDSGVIMFVFGEVHALGLTLAELETRVADGLRDSYLINPRVSVSMEEYRPFFINGQVNQPGAYPYKSGLSVRMAVSIAGGFKERASESSIFVVREADPQHKQSKIGLDGEVFPGDTVTVEESFF